ncbi:MAG TPA: DUF3105 domain-containing protein [Solirubrobacteraceae bacterium]
MASRAEQKERKRREREERERAAARAAKRKRVTQIAGGVVVGLVVIAGVVLAVAGGGKEAKRDSGALTAAARAAGCVVRSFPSEGREHVTQHLTAADFGTNPPTSGNHNITPAPDGVYAPGNEPEIENWVHTLEHGRILFQYRPGTSPARIAQLQKLYDEPVLSSGNGYHSVLMENNTKMPFEVAAVAWQHYVGCPKFTDRSIAALRDFRRVYVDTAPEKIP